MQTYLTLPHEQIQVNLPLQVFLLSEVTNSRSLSKFLAVNTCLFLSVAINFNSEREYFATPTAIIVRSEIASNEISSKTILLRSRCLESSHNRTNCVLEIILRLVSIWSQKIVDRKSQIADDRKGSCFHIMGAITNDRRADFCLHFVQRKCQNYRRFVLAGKSRQFWSLLLRR